MRKTWQAVAALAATAAALCAAEPAAAQGSPLPLRVKLGVILPQDGDTKDFSGSALYGGELDLAIPSPFTGQTLVTAGYYEGRRGGRKLSMIPVTVSRVFSAPNPVAGVTGNVYYGLGIGAYYLRASGGGVSERKTRIGGFGMVGYQFPAKLFVEGKYHLAGDVAGLSPNGLSFLLGWRF